PFDSCWLRFIKSSYIAQRPTHRVNHSGIGLRIPFDVMIQLAAVEGAIVYKNGIVLTGYDTALVPVERIDDECGSIQWHVIFGNNVSDGSMATDIGKYLSGSPLEISMQSSRSTGYLGWCKKVKLTLGAKEIQASLGRTELKETENLYRPIERALQLGPGLQLGAFGNFS